MRLLKGKAGFILVELIIATAILAAVIPLSKFFIDTIKATREAKIQQTANHLAQRYMEEYKGKDLEAIESVSVDEQVEEIAGRNYYVSVDKTPFLVSSDSQNCIGNVNIIKDLNLNEILVRLTSAKPNEGSSEVFAITGAEYTIEIVEASDIRMELWRNAKIVGETDVCLISLSVIPPEGDAKPELDLFVKNNPYLTLNVKNHLDKELIINKIENKNADGSAVNPDFKLITKHGKVGVRDNESIESYQLGAHIIVTVKDKAGDAGETLAKVAQTRLIEWAHSQK